MLTFQDYVLALVSSSASSFLVVFAKEAKLLLLNIKINLIVA